MTYQNKLTYLRLSQGGNELCFFLVAISKNCLDCVHTINHFTILTYSYITILPYFLEKCN